MMFYRSNLPKLLLDVAAALGKRGDECHMGNRYVRQLSLRFVASSVFSLIYFLAGASLVLPVREIFAQQAPSVPRTDRAAVRALLDSLKLEDEELSLLQHFLEASTVDQRLLQNTHVKSWVIGNPAVRDSLFFAFVDVDSSILSEAGTDAIVLATYADDLIEVRFGTTVFKGTVLNEALKRSGDKYLYKKIVDTYKYSRDIELRDEAFSIPTPVTPELMNYDNLLAQFSPLTSTTGNPPPASALAELSLYGMSAHVGPYWGGEIRLGNDELNLPFWSAGTYVALVTYKRFKIGVALPFAGGRETSELISPLILWGRRLSGGRGITCEFDFGPIGGHVLISRFNINDRNMVTDPDRFLLVSGSVLAYYSFGVALGPTTFTRAKVGGGIMRIEEGSINGMESGPNQEPLYTETDLQDDVSPYLKFELQHTGGSERYGASVQFYNMALMFTASLEIVRDLLQIEAKYVWPLSSNILSWQTPDFFMVSPKLRFVF